MSLLRPATSRIVFSRRFSSSNAFFHVDSPIDRRCFSVGVRVFTLSSSRAIPETMRGVAASYDDKPPPPPLRFSSGSGGKEQSVSAFAALKRSKVTVVLSSFFASGSILQVVVKWITVSWKF